MVNSTKNRQKRGSPSVINERRRLASLEFFVVKSWPADEVPGFTMAELGRLGREGALRYAIVRGVPRFAQWQIKDGAVREDLDKINNYLDEYLGGPNVIGGTIVMEKPRPELLDETLADTIDSRELSTRVEAWHILQTLGSGF